MQENSNQIGKIQKLYKEGVQNIFALICKLLERRNTSQWYASFLMTVLMLQMYGFMFDFQKDYNWNDSIFLSSFNTFFDCARLLPMIARNKNSTFYWLLYGFTIANCVVITILIIYGHFELKKKQIQISWLLQFLKADILLLFWVLYTPCFETLVSIFNCENQQHYIVESFTCYEGIHIIFIFVSIVFSIILMLICLMISCLFNETQNVNRDALARLESGAEVELVIYRSILIIISVFCNSGYCPWIILVFSQFIAIIVCVQYFKYLPYYNPIISVYWGSLCCIYFWFALNGILMESLEVEGHIIVIMIGIPIISAVVYNCRNKRVESLLFTKIDKLKSDMDALVQLYTMEKLIKGGNKEVEEVTLIGIVNLHIQDCMNKNCPCKDPSHLYDASTSQYSTEESFHKNKIFLNHFVKRLYEEAIDKFTISPSLHIAFSLYLFDTIMNVHASLIQLNIALKKKPSLRQEFLIFRIKSIIHLKLKEKEKTKDQFRNLTKAIDFENLLKECHKSISVECNFQIEFWLQLANTYPDLNVLNDLNTKIYKATRETEYYWNKLSKINNNYSKALNTYANYLINIRNHHQLGFELQERAKQTIHKTSLDEVVKSSEIVFSEDTVVIQVSGNKETAGRILKTNQSLTKILGYTKSEVIGHSINILMPSIFAKRHVEFLEYFFKTGKEVKFSKDHNLFALHRNGTCFNMQIIIKQIPSISDGIQYVGMIRPVNHEEEFILTDPKGSIDSFSDGITTILGLSSNMFKESEINIQILAPELIPLFLNPADNSESFTSEKGKKITLIVPDGFNSLGKDNKQVAKHASNSSVSTHPESSSKVPFFINFNKLLGKRHHRHQISTEKIMETKEYINCIKKTRVKCQVVDLRFQPSENFRPLDVKVFKISGKRLQKDDSDEESEEISSSEEMSAEEIDKQNPFMNVFSASSNDPQKKKVEVSLENLIQRVPRDNEELPSPHTPTLHSREDFPTEVAAKPIFLQNQNEDIFPLKSLEPEIIPTLKSVVETEEAREKPNLKETPQLYQQVSTFMNMYETTPKGKEESKFERGHISNTSLSELPETEQRHFQEKSPIQSGKNLFLFNNSTHRLSSNESSSVESTPKAQIKDMPQYHKDSLILSSYQKKNDPSVSESIELPDEIIIETGREYYNTDRINSKKEIPQMLPLMSERGHQSPKKHILPTSLKKEENKSDQEEKEKEEDLDKNIELNMEIVDDTESDPRRHRRSLFRQRSSVSGNSSADRRPRHMPSKFKRRIAPANLKIIDPCMTDEESIKAFQLNNYAESEEERQLRSNLLLSERRKERREKQVQVANLASKFKDIQTKLREAKKISASEDSEEDKEGEEIQSSVTSGAATLKSFYSLRSAIEEPYAPPIIKNVRLGSMLFFLILVIIAGVYFALEISRCSSLSNNINFVDNAEKRIYYLMNINLNVLSLISISKDDEQDILYGEYSEIDDCSILSIDDETKNSKYETAFSNIIDYADLLIDVQTKLVLESSTLKENVRAKVNPLDVEVQFKKTGEVTSSYSYTIWQAILEVSTSANQIALLDRDEINLENWSVFYILENSLNSIYLSLQFASKAILDQIYDSGRETNNYFLMLEILAVLIKFIILCLLLPVTKLIAKKRADLFTLFTYIKKKDIEEAISKCRAFLAESVNIDVGVVPPNADEELNEIMKEEEKNEEEKEKENLKKNLVRTTIFGGSKNKKFKALQTKYLGLFLKFSLLIFFLQIFYWAVYIFSVTFTTKINALSEEFGIITRRLPAHTFLLLISKETIFRNGTNLIEFEDSEKFVSDFMESMYKNEELLSDKFTENYDYHSSNYNSKFNSIFYSNLCTQYNLFEENLEECEAFSEGILQKGLYSASIKYWDFLRQIYTDFFDSTRSLSDLRAHFNDNRFDSADYLDEYYFTHALNYLLDIMISDINDAFDNQKSLFNFFLIFAIICLLILFLVVLRKFLNSLQDEISKSKSILAILPPELILNIPEIKNYILANSSHLSDSKALH